MDHRRSSPSPGASNRLGYLVSLARRLKWLIGGVLVLVAALGFALLPVNEEHVWSGRTILKVGLAPTLEYMLLGAGQPLAEIDTLSDTIARISEKDFKYQVASRAAFDPATAAASRSLVVASLRAVDLKIDREISVELSATSASDVKAAFQAVAAQIDHEQGGTLNRRLQLLRADITDSTARLARIDEWTERLKDWAFDPGSDDGNASRPKSLSVMPAAVIPVWNALHDRIRRETSLVRMSEPSRMRPWNDAFLSGSRSVETLRGSLLAGLGLLVAMIILTVIVERPKGSSRG